MSDNDPNDPNDPNDRLTSKQVSELFGIADGTLGFWRNQRQWDKSLPRFHKLRRKVFYVRSEIEEDLKGVCV